MHRSIRIALWLAGACVGQALLVAGLVLIEHTRLPAERWVPAAALIGLGLFTAMWLVIDPMVDGAGRLFVAALKASAAAVFVGGALWSFHAVIQGWGGGVVTL